MIQIWERCKPFQLISPVNTDHAMFIWKSKPDLSFSEKLSRYQNSEILFEFKCYCIIKFIYVYPFTPSLTWIGIFFLQNCFCIKLLIIMFIRMCAVQYWKSNNICNTWKIKEKLTILMTCDVLFKALLHKWW